MAFFLLKGCEIQLAGIFKLVGDLLINGAEKAKKDIQGTEEAAEKASGVFTKVGEAINKSFKDEKVTAFGVSLDRLNSRISGQHKKLDLLKNKYTDLYLTQGETSQEAQEVAAEIEKLSAELNKNEKALSEAKNAADSFDKSLEKVGKESEKAGDEGKNLKDKWKDAIKEFKKAHPVFAKVSVGVAAVGTAVVAAGKAINDIAESTREYRTEMGKLEAAFSASGHSVDVASDTYRELYSIIGETDQAVEAAQQISLLAESTEDAAKWADLAAGVVGQFGDALQPETFFEAANETFSLNEATGAYVQMLEGCQMSVEDFNNGLQACTTAEEKQAYMLNVSTKALGKAGEAYKKNNKEVIAANTAQEKLTAATARWGEVCEPIVTLFKEGLAGAINFAADAFEFLINPADAANEALFGTFETSAQAAESVEFLRGRLAALEQTPPTLWTPELAAQKDQLVVALASAEEKYYALAEAEQNAADSASTSVGSTAESTAEFASITDQYVADAMTLFETFGQTYQAIHDKVSNFFDPFEKASVSVKTSVKYMMDAMQSQVDFNNTYSANLQALKDYGLGALSDAFQSYGANGAAYAAEIVRAVEQAGGATTEQGQAIIQGFQDINQQVTESQDSLSQTMHLMDGEFEQQLNDMVEKYGTAIEDLDKSAEANAAALSTFQAFLRGMNQKLPEIQSQMRSFGSKITSSLQSGIGSITIPATIEVDGTKPNGSHETGLDYVPFDNYLAYLHKGEAVLTAEEAAAWRAGKEVASSGSTGDSGSGGGVTVNQYIESVPQTPVELASTTAAYFEQARWIT